VALFADASLSMLFPQMNDGTELSIGIENWYRKADIMSVLAMWMANQ
jgi:hypothetical protein